MRKIGVGGCVIPPKAYELVTEVLDSGQVTYGKFCRELEDRFASLHGASYGVLSNSGTSSLHVALLALKEKHRWPDGAEVIVPALTFVATVNAVLQAGLKPVFVDVDAMTYNIDPLRLGDVFTSKTVCVIPVHLFGQPAEMPSIDGWCRGRGVSVVEDSCEAVKVRYAGMPVGGMGDIGCFSFYAAHLVTAGVGGISITNDRELARLMRSLVNHGRTGVDAVGPTHKRFEFERAGFSYRISEFEAALALAQLGDLDAQIEARRKNAMSLYEGLRLFPLQLPFQKPNAEHAWMMFPILSEHKKSLVEHLEARGIETRDMLPLTNQPYIRAMFGDIEKAYPNAMKVNREGFYIGCHPQMTDADVAYVVDAFREFYENPRPPEAGRLNLKALEPVARADGGRF